MTTRSPTSTFVTRSDAFDDAGAFVAKHARKRDAEIVVAAVHIGLAHAARGDAHDHFIGARIGEVQRLEPERRAFHERGLPLSARERAQYSR